MNLNAVSLTGCHVLIEESLQFYPVPAWVFPVRPNGFRCLDKIDGMHSLAGKIFNLKPIFHSLVILFHRPSKMV